MKKSLMALGVSVMAVTLSACCHHAGGKHHGWAKADEADMAAPVSESASVAPVMAAASASVEAPPVELLAFDCGSIAIDNVDGFASDGSFAGVSRVFSDGCFLVRHPDGDLLWDTGLPAGLVGKPRPDEGMFRPLLERRLVDHFKDIQLNPADIEFVAISHYHFDHTGQPEAAPNATWLVEARELEAVKGGVDPANMGDMSGFLSKTTQVFEGDHDVFGDGSVIILDMPGHTPGHTSLLVNLIEEGPVLLTGDLYHQHESRESAKVPRFNTSEEETRASIAAFEALAKEKGARVIIQHDARDMDALPKPPEALR